MFFGHVLIDGSFKFPDIDATLYYSVCFHRKFLPLWLCEHLHNSRVIDRSVNLTLWRPFNTQKYQYDPVKINSDGNCFQRTLYYVGTRGCPSNTALTVYLRLQPFFVAVAWWLLMSKCRILGHLKAVPLKDNLDARLHSHSPFSHWSPIFPAAPRGSAAILRTAPWHYGSLGTVDPY